MADSLAILLLSIPMACLGFATGWALRDRRADTEIGSAYERGIRSHGKAILEALEERNVYRKLWADEVQARLDREATNV